MLYLMRKPGESIVINNNIELQVIEVKGKAVKLGFTFPKGSSVLRKELFDKIKAQNIEAAQGDISVEDLLESMPKFSSAKTDNINGNSAEE